MELANKTWMAREAIQTYQAFESQGSWWNPIAMSIKHMTQPLRMKKLFDTLHDITKPKTDVYFYMATYLPPPVLCHSQEVRETPDQSIVISENEYPENGTKNFRLYDFKSDVAIMLLHNNDTGLCHTERAITDWERNAMKHPYQPDAINPRVMNHVKTML